MKSELIRFHAHGANADVVWPVDFTEFLKAVRHVAISLAMINESPFEHADEVNSGSRRHVRKKRG